MLPTASRAVTNSVPIGIQQPFQVADRWLLDIDMAMVGTMLVEKSDVR